MQQGESSSSLSSETLFHRNIRFGQKPEEKEESKSLPTRLPSNPFKKFTVTKAREQGRILVSETTTTQQTIDYDEVVSSVEEEEQSVTNQPENRPEEEVPESFEVWATEVIDTSERSEEQD